MYALHCDIYDNADCKDYPVYNFRKQFTEVYENWEFQIYSSISYFVRLYKKGNVLRFLVNLA
jgi:hypothetical protein